MEVYIVDLRLNTRRPFLICSWFFDQNFYLLFCELSATLFLLKLFLLFWNFNTFIILLVRNSLPTASRWLSLHTRKAYLLSEHQKPPHCLIIGLHIISLAILHGLDLGIQRLQGSLVFSSSENELQTFSRTNVDIHNQIQTDDFNSRNKE